MRHFLLCVAAGLALAGCSKEEGPTCSSTAIDGRWVGGAKTYEFASCTFTYVDGACAANGTFFLVGETLNLDYLNFGDCAPTLNVLGDTFSYVRSGTALTVNGVSYTLQ
jgi:hypothetical protein